PTISDVSVTQDVLANHASQLKTNQPFTSDLYTTIDAKVTDTYKDCSGVKTVTLVAWDVEKPTVRKTYAMSIPSDKISVKESSTFDNRIYSATYRASANFYKDFEGAAQVELL